MINPGLNPVDQPELPRFPDLRLSLETLEWLDNHHATLSIYQQPHDPRPSALLCLSEMSFQYWEAQIEDMAIALEQVGIKAIRIETPGQTGVCDRYYGYQRLMWRAR